MDPRNAPAALDGPEATVDGHLGTSAAPFEGEYTANTERDHTAFLSALAVAGVGSHRIRQRPNPTSPDRPREIGPCPLLVSIGGVLLT